MLEYLNYVRIFEHISRNIPMYPGPYSQKVNLLHISVMKKYLKNIKLNKDAN